MEQDIKQPIMLIRLKQVMTATGLARSTVYKFIADGQFPRSVSLGANSVAWVQSEVQEWIQAKILLRKQKELA